jgi:hypothetical protein
VYVCTGSSVSIVQAGCWWIDSVREESYFSSARDKIVSGAQTYPQISYAGVIFVVVKRPGVKHCLCLAQR